MQTARCTGASIGEGLDHGITPRRQEMVDHLTRRRLGEGGFHRSNNVGNAVALFEQLLNSSKKEVSPGLADVKQANRLARERVESRR